MAQNTSNYTIDPSDVVFSSEDKIGEGGFGCVYSAIWRRPDGTELKVAVKQTTNIDETAEITYLSQLRHDNIISYYGSYQEMTSLIMVTELAEGDLKTRLDEVASLSPSLTQRWVKEAAVSLQYLHSRGLVHRDVKTHNYLLMFDDKLKLADFGLAKELDKTLSTLAKGTHRWMAPEVFSDLKRSKRSDVYSYGMVVWSICTTDLPFASLPSDYAIMNGIKRGKRPPIPDECPNVFKHLIESCWQSEYKKRPSMDVAVQYLQTGKS